MNKSWYEGLPSWVFGGGTIPSQAGAIGRTGAGPDGIVQPNRPIEMVSTNGGPQMLHEGEGKKYNPDGTIQVIPQSELMKMERMGGIGGMQEGGTYTPADGSVEAQSGISQPPEKTSTDFYKQGMGTLSDVASGTSPVFDQTRNRAIGSAAGTMLASEVANINAGISAGLGTEAMATAKMASQAGRNAMVSNLESDLAINARDKAIGAAQSLASTGVSGMAQDLETTKYGDTKAQTDWERSLMYYDPSTPEGLATLQAMYAEKFGGVAPDFNQLKEEREYLRSKRSQDLTAGQQDIEITNDQMYGYDLKDADGNVIGRVRGTQELANIETDLRQQGLTLTEAQVKGYIDPATGYWVKGSIQVQAEAAGQEANALYGYYYDEATGEIISDPALIALRKDELGYVPGAMNLAAKTFGLNTKTYEMQFQELFGINPETGERVLDTEGNPIKGKIEIMNADDRRQAEQLYGYTDDKGMYHPGTLQLMEHEVLIKQQGLTLESAKLFGYEDDKGEHVPGEIEIAAGKFEDYRETYKKMNESESGESLAAHFATMSNVRGYDWHNDEQAKRFLQSYWESTGGVGTYPEDWADNYFAASTVTAVDSAITKLEGSAWFKSLGAPEQESLRQITQMAAYLGVTQGVAPMYDGNGAIVGLKDSEGEVIWQGSFSPSGSAAEVDPVTGAAPSTVRSPSTVVQTEAVAASTPDFQPVQVEATQYVKELASGAIPTTADGYKQATTEASSAYEQAKKDFAARLYENSNGVLTPGYFTLDVGGAQVPALNMDNFKGYQMLQDSTDIEGFSNMLLNNIDKPIYFDGNLYTLTSDKFYHPESEYNPYFVTLKSKDGNTMKVYLSGTAILRTPDGLRLPYTTGS